MADPIIGDTFWPGVDQDTARKVIGTMMPGLASSAITNLAPDPSLPGAAGYIPFTGAGEGLASTLGLLYRLGKGALGTYGTSLPNVPGDIDLKAGEHFANTQNQVYTQLPHYTPTPAEAPVYNSAKDFAQMIGNALPVTGAGTLSALPRAAATVGHYILPTLEGTGARAAIAGSVGPALTEILNPSQAQAAQPDQAATADQQSGDMSGFAGTLTNPFGNAPQPSTTTASGAPGLDLSGINFGGAQAPFHEEGSSGWSVGQSLAGIGVFLAAIAGARFVHGLGASVTTALRDDRVANPTYQAEVQDYHNAQIAAQGGAIANPQGERTPAPLMPAGGTAGTNRFAQATEAVNTALLDETAKTRNYMNLSSTDPTIGERLGNQYSLTLDQSRWNSKLREFLITGNDRDSGVQIPAPKAMNDDIANLSPDQYRTWKLGIDAANEMDNRNRNYRRGVMGQDARYDFPQTDDAQLVAHSQAMMNDPRLADIAQRYWGIGSGIADIGEARGFFTPQEANLLKTERPNYRPDVTTEGTIAHALGQRDITGTGISQVSTAPEKAMAQHVEQIMRQMEINDYILRPMTDHQLDFQRADPNTAQFLKEVPNPYGTGKTLYATLGPSGTAASEPIYQVRRPTGTKFYRSDNSDWYGWMKGQNSNKVLSQVGILDTARRTLQAGTTGVASMLTGRLFPLATHLPRVWLSTGINRAPGTVGSISDALMQRMTGGRVGQRILPDPTSIPGYAYSFGRMQFDKFVNALSDVFRPENTSRSTQLLNSIIGTPQMKAISDSMKNYYLGTVSHEMRAEGATNVGLDVRMRPPAYALGEAGGVKDVRSVSAELSPKLFMPPGVMGTLREHSLNLQKAFGSIYSDLMDAGNQHYYRLNKVFNQGIDPAKLAYETRQLVGNPATHGGSAVTQNITHVIPYGNIGLQATARTARALGETPLGTTAALVGHLGSAALLSLYTMMRYGPSGLQYLSNNLTTQGRAANVVLGTGNTPEENAQYSLPQHIRPLYPLVLDVVSKAMNTLAAQHDPVSFDGMYQFMKDWFSEHIENSTGQSMLHGGADALNFLDTPSIINAITTASGGGDIRLDLEKIVQDARNQGVGFNTFTVPSGTDRALPNHPTGDNLFENEDSKKWHNILTSALGMLGGTLDSAIGYTHTHHLLGNWLDTLGQIKDDAWQHIKDVNPSMNNILWENTARESMRSPIVEQVSRRLNNMQAAGGPRTAELMENTTGGKGPLPVTPQPAEDRAMPTDPAMRNLYNTVRAEHTWIQSSFVGPINQIKKQMQDISGQPTDNQQRREWMNNQTRVVADKYRYINSVIDDVNQKLSAQYGKRIDIGAPIDWKKGVEQFAPLN